MWGFLQFKRGLVLYYSLGVIVGRILYMEVLMEKKTSAVSPGLIITLVLSLGMLIWFCLPGFFNAGTLLGIVLCAVVALCAVFRRGLCGIIKRLWKHIAGRIALCVLAAGLAGFIGFCGYNCVMMANYSSKPLEQVNCVMILGCQVKGSEPGGEMLNRLNTALPLIEVNPDCPIIVTGGQGAGENISEAECMKQWLMEQGIDSSRIYTESNSHSTAQNFTYSAPILAELGISDGIAVVTNDFHQYRAELYAQRLGLSTGHYSVSTRLLVLPNYLIRELAALFFV